MVTLSGFPTDDLEEIAKSGSIIPMRVTETGSEGEPLLEVLVCAAIGGKLENGMPHKVELVRVVAGGETTRESYQHEYPIPLNSDGSTNLQTVRKSPLHDPANHDLIDIFKELKFGRPAASQLYLQKCIQELEDADATDNAN